MEDLTIDQLSLLKDIYYDKKLFFGRDKLYRYLRDTFQYTHRAGGRAGTCTTRQLHTTHQMIPRRKLIATEELAHNHQLLIPADGLSELV